MNIKIKNSWYEKKVDWWTLKKDNLVSYSTTDEESQSFCHSEAGEESPYFKTGNPSAL